MESGGRSGSPPGRFWAVGVGPGDPELLTLKAVRILQGVGVVYHAGPQERSGRAWQIVQGALRPGQCVRVLLTGPMSAIDPADWRTSYRPGVEQIAADCHSGLDVAFVTEGDPTLYSTASYVWQLLHEIAPEITVEIVPGVTSITAAAARMGWPLARKEETLAVVPAGYHRHELSALLRAFPTVCLLKVASALPQLTQALAEIEPEREAVYVENLGTAEEWISHDLETAAGRGHYFALVLVRRTEGSGESVRRGKVWLVGLGPGDVQLLTGQARAVLADAEVLVGYEGYLRLLEPLGLRGTLLGSPIGAEGERARQALEQAQQGRRVVLVSSGDAGVYGMASLLLETAATLPDLDIEVVPGVTAAVAAAALLGAPLGHDFACVSLSDLLTPWDSIERRLHAVGQGDLVLALYNPCSQRRTWQLPRARDILLNYRSPGTPVGMVTRAYRPGMDVQHTTLGKLSTEGVTMETILIVGSTQTRLVNGRLVTPRGYPERA